MKENTELLRLTHTERQAARQASRSHWNALPSVRGSVTMLQWFQWDFAA